MLSTTKKIDSLPSAGPPPSPSKCRDSATNHNCIIEIGRCHGQDCWEEEHHADEEYPSYRYPVQRLLKLSQDIWPWSEFYAGCVKVACQDDCCIREVEARGGDVEDGHHGLCRANSNAIEKNTK